jgi:hypothetical protein
MMMIPLEQVHAIDIAKQAVVQSIKQPLKLPTTIPGNKRQPLFAAADVEKGDYTIFFDTTDECQGAHYCNVGSIGMHHNAKLEKITAFNKVLTEIITLPNGKIAYFTPSHNAADHWPAMIEWKQGDAVYSISWDLPESQEKSTLVKMATSMQP